MTDGVVVVTGAVRGMRLACAQRLVHRGHRMLIVDRDAMVGEVARLLGAAGAGVESMRCDITNRTDVDGVAERIRTMGGLASLIHAAGVSPSMGDWRAMFAVDLVGTALMIEATRSLATAGTAAVCFASIAAHGPSGAASGTLDAILDEPLVPDLLDRLIAASPALATTTGLAYSLAKRGVIRMVERDAAAWGERGARICSVSPGIINTPMGLQELEQQPQMAVMLENTPLARPAHQKRLLRLSTSSSQMRPPT